MIKVDRVSKFFGGICALDSISFTVTDGSITGLIGPNGAGKTTIFNIIAGLLTPDSGQVLLQGESIIGLKAHELFNKGVLRTFQIAHEFTTMTVLENLMVVPPNQMGETIINTWFRRGQIREEERVIRQKAEDVIEFLKIGHLANELAGNLSGGQKKLLELGRTMMVDAKLVLLDEVGAGVNRALLEKIGEAIVRLNQERGYTFCMIEHDMDFIAKLCDPVIVMAEGRLLAKGTAREVLNSSEVIDAYLGQGLKNKDKITTTSFQNRI